MLDQKQLDEYRKDIKFNETLCDKTLSYNSTWGIFSPREIDAGTKLNHGSICISKSTLWHRHFGYCFISRTWRLNAS